MDQQDMNTTTGTDTVLVVIAHTSEVRESEGTFSFVELCKAHNFLSYTFVFTRKLSFFMTGVMSPNSDSVHYYISKLQSLI
jgi:hypothetical protein